MQRNQFKLIESSKQTDIEEYKTQTMVILEKFVH